MVSPRKLLVLLCDDPLGKEHASCLLASLNPPIQTELVATLSQLRQLLTTCVPDIILVYTTPHQAPCRIQDLRRDISLDHIPIYQYTTLPCPQELHRLLLK